jgi:hypothetical protein
VQAIASLLQLIGISSSAGVAFSGLLVTQLEDGGRKMNAPHLLVLILHLNLVSIERASAAFYSR